MVIRREGVREKPRLSLLIGLSFRPGTGTAPWLPRVQAGPGFQVPRLCQVYFLPLHMSTISKLLVSYSRRSGMNPCVSTTVTLASSI